MNCRLLEIQSTSAAAVSTPNGCGESGKVAEPYHPNLARLAAHSKYILYSDDRFPPHIVRMWYCALQNVYEDERDGDMVRRLWPRSVCNFDCNTSIYTCKDSVWTMCVFLCVCMFAVHAAIRRGTGSIVQHCSCSFDRPIDTRRRRT